MKADMLRLLIAHPNESISTDDVTPDLQAPRPGGGQWCGSAPKGLQADGLIRWTKAKRSTRRHRRGTILGCWRRAAPVADLKAALASIEKELRRLQSGLDRSGRRRVKQATFDDLEPEGQ